MIDYWRQLGILPPRELANLKLTIVGVGGIGSPTALSLAKMGVPVIKAYDHDVVDAHNLPNQLYRLRDIGKKKVFALQEILGEFSETRVEPIPEFFDETRKPQGVLISAVDKMTERSKIWRTVRYNVQVPLYIEARMGIEVIRIYTIRPTDPMSVRWYEKFLYSDEEALVAPCTERSISYTVFMAAALIADQVKKYVKGESYNKEIIFDMKNLLIMLQ